MKRLLLLFLCVSIIWAQITPPYYNNGAGGSVTVDGQTCTIGASCTPVQDLLTSYKSDFQNGVCSGTAYTLTTNLSSVVCGTDSPTVILPAAGTYLILFSARIDNISATYVASRTVSVFLSRTNNGGGDLNEMFVLTGVQTTSTATSGTITGFSVFTTLNNDDALTLRANIDTLASAGSTAIPYAKISTIRLA